MEYYSAIKNKYFREMGINGKKKSKWGNPGAKTQTPCGLSHIRSLTSTP